MGLAEILIILGISLAAGFGTVEYQRARSPDPFKSPAPGYSADDQPVINGVRINGERAEV